MGERKRDEISPLDYDIELTLEEAGERYAEVKEAFKQVEKRYSGIIGGRKKKIAEEDMGTLTDCIGVLLPLGMNSSVQQEIQEAEDPTDTLFDRSGQLQAKVMLFASRFENSGVKRIEGDSWMF